MSRECGDAAELLVLNMLEGGSSVNKVQGALIYNASRYCC